MAITIDTTPAGEAANSYVTTLEADAYFEANLAFGAQWAAMDETQKAARLVRAAQALDRIAFVGVPVSNAQALAFPRLTLPTRGDPSEIQLDIADLTIPSVVKRAQCEMLIQLWADTDAEAGRSAGTREIESAEVDGVASVTYADAGDREGREAAAGGSLAAVAALLKPWLASTHVGAFDWSR